MTDAWCGRSDAELVELAQGGSAPAFAALYDRHVAGIARALASFAGPDRDLLDDLVQEVFLRVVRGLAAYTAIQPFTHWLYTVALNVGRNHARRRVVDLPLETTEFAQVAAPEGADVDGAMLLMRMVAGLPDAMRDVVGLRIGSDLPFAEIATMLGIPEGTARSRMHNAVRLLRERYATGTRNRGIPHA
jgi:RNA polymerase sigma-70 factor (ECF subfamily)